MASAAQELNGARREHCTAPPGTPPLLLGGGGGGGWRLAAVTACQALEAVCRGGRSGFMHCTPAPIASQRRGHGPLQIGGRISRVERGAEEGHFAGPTRAPLQILTCSTIHKQVGGRQARRGTRARGHARTAPSGTHGCAAPQQRAGLSQVHSGAGRAAGARRAHAVTRQAPQGLARHCSRTAGTTRGAGGARAAPCWAAAGPPPLRCCSRRRSLRAGPGAPTRSGAAASRCCRPPTQQPTRQRQRQWTRGCRRMTPPRSAASTRSPPPPQKQRCLRAPASSCPRCRCGPRLWHAWPPGCGRA